MEKAMEKVQNPGGDMLEKRLAEAVTKALDGHLQSTSSQVRQQKPQQTPNKVQAAGVVSKAQ